MNKFTGISKKASDFIYDNINNPEIVKEEINKMTAPIEHAIAIDDKPLELIHKRTLERYLLKLFKEAVENFVKEDTTEECKDCGKITRE